MTWKRCKIWWKFILITNTKSHMSFKFGWYENRTRCALRGSRASCWSAGRPASSGGRVTSLTNDGVPSRRRQWWNHQTILILIIRKRLWITAALKFCSRLASRWNSWMMMMMMILLKSSHRGQNDFASNTNQSWRPVQQWWTQADKIVNIEEITWHLEMKVRNVYFLR